MEFNENFENKIVMNSKKVTIFISYIEREAMVFNATFNNIVVKWEGSGAMVTVIFYIII
jgi:hypothetical protein